MLREGAKVTKEIKERKMFKLSKRLGAEEEKEGNQVMGQNPSNKFKKGPDEDLCQSTAAHQRKCRSRHQEDEVYHLLRSLIC